MRDNADLVAFDREYLKRARELIFCGIDKSERELSMDGIDGAERGSRLRVGGDEVGCGLLVGGMDEAGRGPLAGPVACAVAVMPLDDGLIVGGADDSKKIPEKKREILYEAIVKNALYYNIQFVWQDEIDGINILNATKKGMRACFDALPVKPDILLIDAVNLDIAGGVAIIKGDAKSYNIACASILAKVERDRLMRRYDAEYPGYGFARHKGYGVTAHYEAIARLGITPLHRKTFLSGFKNLFL
ncbi:MAG: ribonuclease HII [Clostridiales bacterium]|jgi:ribonuclease HII|nr:ribonuclease HII [Clostridiales bacterium]